MSEQQAIKGYVSGRVQGVGFRMATERQAIKSGLTGWVRNFGAFIVVIIIVSNFKYNSIS